MQTDDAAPHYVPPVPDPEVMDQLRQAVLADPARAAALVKVVPRSAAVAALAEFGRELGLNLNAEHLGFALSGDPIGLDRFQPRPITGVERPGPDWLPLGLSSDGAQVTVDWGHFGTGPRDPFFAADVRQARSHPVSALLRWRTPLGSLIDQFAAAPPRLDGLVFHMSRCGSTMVNRALAALPGSVALSEPPALDEVVQLCQSRDDFAPEFKLALLRAMAGALTSGQAAATTRRFIKTDCWHAGALPLFRAAFPDTPWIFLYRDPIEVLISHEAMPGSQTLPGHHAALVGIDEPQALPGLDFSARVLAGTCHAAANHAGIGGGLFIDYADLPGAIWDRILPHFGIAPDPVERAAIEASLDRDAKQPGKRFDPHERKGRDTASDAVRAASAAHLAPAVERLRALGRGGVD